MTTQDLPTNQRRNPYEKRTRFQVATLNTACMWSARMAVPDDRDAMQFARNLMAQLDVVRVHLWDNGELVQRLTPVPSSGTGAKS